MNCFNFLQSLDELKMASSDSSAKSWIDQLSKAIEKIEIMSANALIKDSAYQILVICLEEYYAYLDIFLNGHSKPNIYKEMQRIEQQIKYYKSINK